MQCQQSGVYSVISLQGRPARARRIASSLIRALDVAGLRYEDEVLPSHGPSSEDVPHDFADEGLAVTIRVVRGGVHERDARDERLAQGLAVNVAPVVHSVAAEADPRDARVNAAERAVRGRGQP